MPVRRPRVALGERERGRARRRLVEVDVVADDEREVAGEIGELREDGLVAVDGSEHHDEVGSEPG